MGRALSCRRVAGRRGETPVHALTLRGLPWLFLTALSACAARPPQFAIEPEPFHPLRDRPVLAIGAASTPPPGVYRFARFDADGTAEVRELHTVNGPGPWLAYVGQVAIAPGAVGGALSDIERAGRTGSPPVEEGTACVRAFRLESGEVWEGCGYPGIAARLLARVPSIAPPDPAPGCPAPLCQVRMLQERPAGRHEQQGLTEYDVVLDAAGRYWCARREPSADATAVTLRVHQGRILSDDVPALLRWIVPDTSASDAAATPASPHVLIRGAESSWHAIAEPGGSRALARWRRLRSRLPDVCRP
jgi:hypothetical protein